MPDIKLLLDVHVHSAVTSGLRRRGIEVLTCQEAKMDTAKDMEILEFAFSGGYVIFSQDTDFLNICSTKFPHKGLVYSHKQNDVGRIIRGLMLICEILDPNDMENHIEFI